jgi:hypothetical protein
MPRILMTTVCLSAGLALVSGCAEYAVPGKGADFRAMQMTPEARAQQTDPSVGVALERKPMATFPATIAVARIQDSDYKERTIQLYGSGTFRVAITRDVEKQEQFDKLAAMPMVRVLEPFNRLVLPENLTSVADLRTAAATLHADMLLLYTFDDTFEDRDDAAMATILTIGIAPTKSLTVRCVASAVLIDVHNGYIYGAAAADASKTTLADCWGENAAADAVREEVESKAFVQLCDRVQMSWASIVKEYAPAARQ